MRKYLNTQILDQIDWEKEIANQPSVSDDEQATLFHDSVMVWCSIDDFAKRQMETMDEDHKKANLMRMLQYFYGKFIYNHGLFYKEKTEDFDLKIEMNKYKKLKEDHTIIIMKKKFKKLPKSNLHLVEIIKLGMLLNESRKTAKKKAEEKFGSNDFEQAKEMFSKEGMEVTKPVNFRKEGDRDTVCVIYDGVPYHMYLMRSSLVHEERNQQKVKEEITEFEMLKERHHDLIKKIYEKICQIPDIGDVWVLSGGGAQLQAFFGNNKGYLGILYFDLKNKKKSNDIYTFVTERNPELFKGFKIDGVKFRTFEGKNL